MKGNDDTGEKSAEKCKALGQILDKTNLKQEKDKKRKKEVNFDTVAHSHGERQG